jgi:hypothetical protein
MLSFEKHGLRVHVHIHMHDLYNTPYLLRFSLSKKTHWASALRTFFLWELCFESNFMFFFQNYVQFFHGFLNKCIFFQSRNVFHKCSIFLENMNLEQKKSFAFWIKHGFFKNILRSFEKHVLQIHVHTDLCIHHLSKTQYLFI